MVEKELVRDSNFQNVNQKNAVSQTAFFYSKKKILMDFIYNKMIGGMNDRIGNFQ